MELTTNPLPSLPARVTTAQGHPEPLGAPPSPPSCVTGGCYRPSQRGPHTQTHSRNAATPHRGLQHTVALQRTIATTPHEARDTRTPQDTPTGATTHARETPTTQPLHDKHSAPTQATHHASSGETQQPTNSTSTMQVSQRNTSPWTTRQRQPSSTRATPYQPPTGQHIN